MNRVERLTAVLLLLQERPRTSEEIAARFEVSKRTVLRDIDALCQMGVPVVSRNGVGGGYSLPQSYRVAPLPLTTREAFLMLLSLDAISKLPDAPFGEERAPLVAKLRTLLTPQQLPEVDRLLEAASVDVPPRVQRSRYLDALTEAAKERRWVQVVYESTERRSTQHLLPLNLSSQSGFWYLRAYAHEHTEERTYRVDRIKMVAEPSEHFAALLPQEGDLSIYTTKPYADESHPRIMAQLTPRGVAYVESEPHLGQLIRRMEDGTGYLAFHCPPSELDYYARYFLSLGSEVHVDGPEALRDRILQLGQEVINRYKEQTNELNSPER